MLLGLKGDVYPSLAVTCVASFAVKAFAEPSLPIEDLLMSALAGLTCSTLADSEHEGTCLTEWLVGADAVSILPMSRGPLGLTGSLLGGRKGVRVQKHI